MLFVESEGGPDRRVGLLSTPLMQVAVTVGVPESVSPDKDNKGVKSIPRMRDSVLYCGAIGMNGIVF